MNGRKISAQVVGMALGSIAVWAAGAFGGVIVPPEVAVAVGTVMSVGVSLAIPDSKEAE